jgi:hypothetical protein
MTSQKRSVSLLYQLIIISVCFSFTTRPTVASQGSNLILSEDIQYENQPDLTMLKKSEPIQQQYYHSSSSSNAKDCCEKPIIITSAHQSEGYLKAPPLYDEMNEPKNYKKTIECLYKFFGKPNERIQLFYEDFDLYYPYDIYKFYKIEYLIFNYQIKVISKELILYFFQNIAVDTLIRYA